MNKPFELEVVAENAEKVTWLLEQEIIEAEPEEGLIICQEGILEFCWEFNLRFKLKFDDWLPYSQN